MTKLVKISEENYRILKTIKDRLGLKSIDIVVGELIKIVANKKTPLTEIIKQTTQQILNKVNRNDRVL